MIGTVGDGAGGGIGEVNFELSPSSCFTFTGVTRSLGTFAGDALAFEASSSLLPGLTSVAMVALSFFATNSKRISCKRNLYLVKGEQQQKRSK